MCPYILYQSELCAHNKEMCCRDQDTSSNKRLLLKCAAIILTSVDIILSKLAVFLLIILSQLKQRTEVLIVM
jgi:hypothetical protein